MTRFLRVHPDKTQIDLRADTYSALVADKIKIIHSDSSGPIAYYTVDDVVIETDPGWGFSTQYMRFHKGLLVCVSDESTCTPSFKPVVVTRPAYTDSSGDSHAAVTTECYIGLTEDVELQTEEGVVTFAFVNGLFVWEDSGEGRNYQYDGIDKAWSTKKYSLNFKLGFLVDWDEV